MTRMECLAEIAQEEANMRTYRGEAEKLLYQQGFMDKYQALDYEAKMRGARQRIWSLKHDLDKLSA